MKATLGILGGGQLALYLCESARRLGIETAVLSPDADAPARAACDQFIHADYADTAAQQTLANRSDVATLDNEHIPEDTLLNLAAQLPLYPQPRVMSRLRDRLAQRGLLTQLNIPQVRFWSIDKAPSARAAARAAAFPAVLKRRHGGYDGYGQIKVASADALLAAWEQFEQAPCVLEAWVRDVQEFSLVGVRDSAGGHRLYPAIANQHANGRLIRSDIPANLAPQIVADAQAMWTRIASSLSIRGVLTVEFFISAEHGLLVNEIAPRVHNSGHITQLVSPMCQFAAHVAALLELPLADISQAETGTMWNIYPEHDLHDPVSAQLHEKEFGGRILLYGKTPRPLRKMGHWLVPANQSERVSQWFERFDPARH